MHIILFRFNEKEGLKSKAATELNSFDYYSVSVRLKRIYILIITYLSNAESKKMSFTFS